jgi:hypothetical protein
VSNTIASNDYAQFESRVVRLSVIKQADLTVLLCYVLSSVFSSVRMGSNRYGKCHVYMLIFDRKIASNDITYDCVHRAAMFASRVRSHLSCSVSFESKIIR